MRYVRVSKKDRFSDCKKERYTERIVLLIYSWLRLRPHLSLMQDNAPAHAGRLAQEELLERGLRLILQPPFSPDLNPIEDIWNWMKDYIKLAYEIEKTFNSYDNLRRVVKEAWEAVPLEKLVERLETMPQRCQDVIDAEGGYTNW